MHYTFSTYSSRIRYVDLDHVKGTKRVEEHIVLTSYFLAHLSQVSLLIFHFMTLAITPSCDINANVDAKISWPINL